MKIARTRNTVKGSFWGIISRIISILFPFVIRTIIIRSFGMEYLGLNSLFTSILQVLNLSELGLSSAIVYSMYKPVAEENNFEIGALLRLYRKLYRWIGVAVLSLGLLCTPFVPYLIKADYPREINIYYLFLIFLSNTSLSYLLFEYKESILNAYQRNDIINKLRIVANLGMYIVQIATLLILKNYYLYALQMVVFTIIRGILISVTVDRLFPEIKEEGVVCDETKKKIKETTLGAAIGKVCSATRGTCDNIIISAFLGLHLLAIFDNYYYILASIVSILSVIEQSLVAGVGNSIETESVDKNQRDFTTINFLYMWIVGFCTTCLICMYQPFMILWVGNEQLVSTSTMLLFGLYFYVYGLSSIPSVYANANGLWWKMKTKSIFEVVLNLGLNYMFVKLWGINGILIATISTLVFISFAWCSLVLFHNYFKQLRIRELFLRHVLYFLITVVSVVVSFYLCSLVVISSLVLKLVFNLVVCFFVSNLIYLIAYCWTSEFKQARLLIRSII